MGKPGANVYFLVVPLHGTEVDFPRAHGVTPIEVIEKVVPEDDSPPVRHTRGVAFDDRDVVARVSQLHQDRKVEAGGSATNTDDLHTLAHPSPRRSGVLAIIYYLLPPVI